MTIKSEPDILKGTEPLLDLMKKCRDAGLGYPGVEWTNGFEVTGVNPDVNKAWITTYTGKKFYHLNPQPEQVNIEDIAHALSMLCRWTGHTRFHYSVAQHSWYCSQLVTPEFALSALLHDSSEAYLGDMNRPLKHYTEAGRAYHEVEEKVEAVIFKKFGVPFPLPEVVKVIDTQMLYAEKAQIINAATTLDYEHNKWGRDETKAPIRIEKWTPRRAEKMFLRRFEELTKEK